MLCRVLVPPLEPMLAKLVDRLPSADGFMFEPEWDGFRAIVFRTADHGHIQSRDLRPLDRYFDVLELRLHPAASRVAKLAKESPASFVAFDLLAVDRQELIDVAQSQRGRKLEVLLADTSPPVDLTPMTRGRIVAAE